MSKHCSVPAFSFQPDRRAPWQARAIEAWERNDCLFFLGPPRSGKSHVAVALAVRDALANKRPKILVTRPAVEAVGERLGFMPGDVAEKMQPWMAPIHHVLGKTVHGLSPKMIEAVPVGYLRGWTVENATLVVDEAQNLTWAALKLILTRLGRNGKVVFAGDPEQSDIRPTCWDRGEEYRDYQSDLEAVADTLEDEKVPRVAVIDIPAGQTVGHPIATAAARLL